MAGRFEKHNPLADVRFAATDGVAPMVTVIVTSFNYGKYIVRCLSSVARQTYPRFKCIVVDDCSNDDSVALIEKFVSSAESHGRFSLVKQERNGGQMGAIKAGLQDAEGDFVVMVDAHDILFDNFLEAHVKAHLGRRSVSFTSSNQYQINERDEILAGEHTDLQARTRRHYIAPRSFHEQWWVWATTSSMMFRRAVLDLIMPDNTEAFRVCADNYLCHFANLLGGSLLIPESYGCYRRHGANRFASNPVLGGHLPIGDLKRHPAHQVVRLSILDHLLSRHQEFSALLSPRNFFATLLRLTGPIDLIRYRFRYPASFARTPFSWPSFVAASAAIKARRTVRRYKTFLWQVSGLIALLGW